jgi:hypothetical protein
MHPGARAILEAKAMKLVGGRDTPLLVAGHGAVQGVFLADRADVMLSYCSGSGPVMQEIPGLVSVALPPELAVGPAYGMILQTEHPLAARFALFVLSEHYGTHRSHVGCGFVDATCCATRDACDSLCLGQPGAGTIMSDALGSFGDLRLDKGGLRSLNGWSRARRYACGVWAATELESFGWDGSLPTRR